jgi:hypothetical protein
LRLLSEGHEVKNKFPEQFSKSKWSKKLIDAHLRWFGFQLADLAFKKGQFSENSESILESFGSSFLAKSSSVK